mmetsp:Transcript_752/g.2875  ORF Transcript_752/g.2875 Transcript_752/m.2875 type:complete len:242 (-) Transcript_752:145-870(-)
MRASCAAALSAEAASATCLDLSASALDLSASRFQSASAASAPVSSVLSCAIFPWSTAAFDSASFALDSALDFDPASLLTKSAFSFFSVSRDSRNASSLRSSSPTALVCANDTSFADPRASKSVALVCSKVESCTAAADFISPIKASVDFSEADAACLNVSNSFAIFAAAMLESLCAVFSVSRDLCVAEASSLDDDSEISRPDTVDFRESISLFALARPALSSFLSLSAALISSERSRLMVS